MVGMMRASGRRGSRRGAWRQFVLFVTLPGLFLGSAGVATAFGVGLFGTKASAGCTPELVFAPPRNSFVVSVQNSNETAGEGSTVARALAKRGFALGTVSNAPEGVYIKRAALVYHGPEGLDEALLVVKQIPGARSWNDGRPGRGVEVVLGYGFKGLIEVPPPPPPKPSQIKVNVYNTTWRAGLAALAAADLEARTFQIDQVGNDPTGSFLPDDVAVIRFGADGLDQAKVLQQHLPGARLQQDERGGSELDLVLGNGYHHLLELAYVPVPKKLPPTPPEQIARPCSR